MRTLRNGHCLNDEVINVYMKSLAAMNKQLVEDGILTLTLKISVLAGGFFVPLFDVSIKPNRSIMSTMWYYGYIFLSSADRQLREV